MADTLTTSPYAAGIHRDAETIHIGQTEDEAIDEAMEAEAKLMDRYGYGLDPTVEVEVYEGVTWCTGAGEDEDCYCGMNHEDHDGGWLLHAWKRRTVKTLDTAPWSVTS